MKALFEKVDIKNIDHVEWYFSLVEPKNKDIRRFFKDLEVF